MYFNGVLPFIDKGFMIKNVLESVAIDSIYCPIRADYGVEVESVSGTPNVFCVQPLNIYLFNEIDDRAYAFKRDLSGKTVDCNVTYIDYHDVAKKIIVEGNKALIKQNRSFIDEDVVNDILINLASNNLSIAESDMLTLNQLTLGTISKKISFDEFINSTAISEAFDALSFFKGGKNLSTGSNISDKTDTIYEYLDSYFSSKSDDAEKVPLLIGPTGVFKSATVKRLCDKHDFRLVDFRVAFTARLDYSGLFERLKIRMGYCEDEHVTVLDKNSTMVCSVCGKEIKRVENEQYSYSCPMEELVTCSDGFREYCKHAIIVLQEQLDSGVIEVSSKSSGNSSDVTTVDLTSEQKQAIKEMLDKYVYYAKTPVMFFDEITRCQDKGVEGVLMTLLNQKTFQNLSLKGCKFVAATNLDLGDSDLDRLYDVNRNTDSAFTARFTPIKVTPESVRDRWIDWAEQDRKGYGGDKNIHPDLLRYLKENTYEIYNKDYVKDVYFENYDEKEAAATSFPNYRTWDLVSQYIYKELSIGNTLMNYDTIKGLIGKTSTDMLFEWLSNNNSVIQKNTTIEKKDEVDAFLKTNLDANVPAMIIGPSSLGKTTRVMNYAKSINAEVIAINLASKSKSDLMGMPVKETLNSYVTGDLGTKSLKGLTDKLGKVLKNVKDAGHGIVDVMTLRAPDSTIKEQFLRAYNEGRDIILFFDECNRVTNPAVLSIMFECFTGDAKVRLLDGRSLTMEELYVELSNGNNNLWTYSIDKDGNIVPGHITTSIRNTPKKRLVKVTLEDGSEYTCTEDHKWMLKDGSYVETKDLTDDMELMEIQKDYSCKLDGHEIDGYELVKTQNMEGFIYTHRMVAESLGMSESGKVIHHEDFCKLNNNPDNLNCSMNYLEHIEYHGLHLKDMIENTDFEEKRLKGWYEAIKDPIMWERIVGTWLDAMNTEDANRKSAETRKRLCEESKEYRESLSRGLIKFNIESALDGRKSEWMREFHKNNPEVGEKFNQAGIEATKENWKNEEYREKMKAIHKERCNNEEFKSRMRDNAVKNNSNEEIKMKQQLGKISNIIRDCLVIEGNVSKELYESVRLSKYKYGYPSYDKCLVTLSKIGTTIENLIKEISL